MKYKLAVSLKSKISFRILIGIIILLIIAGSYLFYRQQADSLRHDKYNYLKAIADLRESQISNWLQERNANAKVFAQDPFFIDGINRWLKDTSNVKLKEVITRQIKLLQKEFNYENVFIANKYGDPLLSATDSLTEINAIINQKIAEASVKREIVATDFYHNQKEEKIYYDIIVPIYSDKKLSAVIIFRIDPSVSLFPLIQNWPIPSKSAETLILRVENDSMVFLNDLRFNKNTALKFKIPLSRTEVPEVQAALGRIGLFEGIDYRGVEVLYISRFIEGAKWIMLIKVDTHEIYAELNWLSSIFIGLPFLLILICGIGLSAIYNSRQKSIFKELYSKEKELWGQQEKFKVTIDSLGEGIIILDIDGKVQYMNSIAEELTEWNLREARGRELHDIYQVKNQRTGQRENKILDKIYKEGIVKELGDNTILITKSGKEIPVMDTGAPVYDHSENIIGVVISFQDETKKRYQHQQLEESEERYRLLVDSIPELSIMVFDSNLRFIVAGGEEISKSGFDRNSVEGRTLSEAFPPDVEKLFTPLYNKALKGESTSFDHEYGNCLYHQMILPLIDSTGKIFGGMVISRNITESRQNEMSLLAQLNLGIITSKLISLDELYPLSIDSLLGLSGMEFGMIYLFDEQMKNLDMVYSKGITEQFVSEASHYDEHSDQLKFIKSGTSAFVFYEELPVELRIIDYAKRCVSVAVLHLVDKGNVIGCIILGTPEALSIPVPLQKGIEVIVNLISHAIIRIKSENEIRSFSESLEIKIQERTEQLEMAKSEADRANHSKSEFLSRMSHELRTPLNSILGFTQLMNRSDTNPESKKRINQIMNSGMYLLDLINEVLDLSQVESGSVSLSLEPVQLSGIITEILDIIQPIAEKREVKLELTESPFNDLFVKADSQKLKQVLINLVNNSVKYNRQGGEVEVSITTSGENIRINIRDTGIGIAAEDIPKLFVPFQRIGAEISEVEGTGLGLAVAKKLVVAMNGNIGVESVAAIGSNFWIELQQTENQMKSDRKSNISKIENRENTHGGTILYIEDNISNIQLVEDILGTERPTIKLVTEMYGKKAVQIAKDYKPGLILLDLDLPDIHGCEVLELLQVEPATKDIPVVVLSANATSQSIEQLMAAGARHYLTKPLDVDKFLVITDELLN